MTELTAMLTRQGYKIVGSHSAVKTCHWLKGSLTKGQVCYKEKFYGIRSHRCLQMSPAVAYCPNACLYCWRTLPGEKGAEWDGLRMPPEDDPKDIVDGAIKAHRKAVNGFKGNPHVKEEMWDEAMNPKHVAISLSGEPTNYSRIGELLGEFKSRGMTTFLVTNGTNPATLLEMSEEPSQLYVSLSAPTEEIYDRVCRPMNAGNWERLMATLSALGSFSCPTVIRITAVCGLNMQDAEGYAKIISRSDPTYVEVKAYMHVGASTARLGFEAMPGQSEILELGKGIAAASGYEIADQVPISRVVLLKGMGK